MDVVKKTKRKYTRKTKNPWIEFVKNCANEKGIKYNVALKQCRDGYKSSKKMGSGLISDTIKLVKNKGKELIKNEANKLIDEGVNILKKKVGLKNGEGIVGDILKYGKNQALNLVPMPGIVRDVAGYTGDKLIEKSGLGLKVRKTKKNMGGSLMPAGY